MLEKRLTLQNKLDIVLWMVLSIMVNLLPLVFYGIYIHITGDNPKDILCGFVGDEISFKSLEVFFRNGLGYAYLTVSIVGSFLCDKVLSRRIKMDEKKAHKIKKHEYITTTCMLICLVLLAINPALIAKKSSLPFKGMYLIDLLQIIVFTLSAFHVFKAKQII